MHHDGVRQSHRSAVAALVLTVLLCGGTALSARAQCDGDCDGDMHVSIDDVIKLVGVALESVPVTQCNAGDIDLSSRITVDEILVAVNMALTSSECSVAAALGAPCSAQSAGDCPPGWSCTGGICVTAAGVGPFGCGGFVGQPCAAGLQCLHYGEAGVCLTRRQITEICQTSAASNFACPPRSPSPRPTQTTAATVNETVATADTPTHTASSTVAPPTQTATPTAVQEPTYLVRRCTLKTASQIHIQTIIGPAVDTSLSGYETWVFSTPDEHQERQISIPVGGTHFNGVTVLGLVKICSRLGADGFGLLDCDGGADGYNLDSKREHDTSQQDPECDDCVTNPDRQMSCAYRESTIDPHPGRCVGPLMTSAYGPFPPGGMTLSELIYLRIVGDTTLVCPADNAPFDADAGDIALSGVLTTGTASAIVVKPEPVICGIVPCDDGSITGTPFGCDNIDNSVLSSGKLVGAFPITDVALGAMGNEDLVATTQIMCQ